MRKPQSKLTPDQLGRLIYEIRGQRVMLDSDLAAIYGIPTFRFNEAIKRNRERFPKDFMFQLTGREFTDLISQIAISSSRHGGRRKLPYAFTEHGALQAANVLRSKQAVAMSLFVIRAFIELRDKIATNAAILKRLAEIDKTLLLHDSALRGVYKKLLPLLAPTSAPPRKRIGFHQ
jgi:ORF6N domain